MQDKKIKCKICGTEFDFTIGQQEFFKEHNLTEPRKCKDCKPRENGGGASGPPDIFEEYG